MRAQFFKGSERKENIRRNQFLGTSVYSFLECYQNNAALSTVHCYGDEKGNRKAEDIPALYLLTSYIRANEEYGEE